MSVELIGKFMESLPLRTGASNKGGEWRVQDFIMEIGGQYPKKVCISLWNEKIDTLTHLKVGDDIKASVDIESREFNGKWYTNIKAWQVEKMNSKTEVAQSLPEIPPHNLSDIPPEEENDDLPF
ncbi:MAG: DUF3127 domain-containing protein [Bacteroidales bacterium]|nr:DUF3127 domain-containing protein [Bacteroidales bacterium]